MTTNKYKCTLLSDVILNQKSASEGANKTLDFIPGSCFLGIVASVLYKNNNDEAWTLFHSGKVRFGDAHPSLIPQEAKSQNTIRGLKIPASMYYPKLKKMSEECYIHHDIPDDVLSDSAFKAKQIKQCRSGFYTFIDNKATEVETKTSFAIKSSYDRENRRSAKSGMFGYESLHKGLELLFEVECDDDALSEKITKALTDGLKHIGRSRTAQYGLVKIEPYEYADAKYGEPNNDIFTVYADSRLVFLDEHGIPTFRPTAEQLGFENGTILEDKCQIRTFQYSPWNFHRQCFDTDRCGIEKGSVFVVKTNEKDIKHPSYIGSYNNEGFGKVIYNPLFLSSSKEYDEELKIEVAGRNTYRILEKKEEHQPETNTLNEVDNLKKSGINLCIYIASRKQDEYEQQKIYELVTHFVDDEKQGGLFTRSGERFASQWGQIRSIATKTTDFDKLYSELFYDKDDDKPKGYLMHGIAKSKWSMGRIKTIIDFFNEVKKEKLAHRISEAIVNLASEMGKEMRRKENYHDSSK